MIKYLTVMIALLSHANIFLILKTCLLSIFWMPKLHTSSKKGRFIITAPICSLKPLSKYITSVFKLMFNKVRAVISEVLSFQLLSHFA